MLVLNFIVKLFAFSVNVLYLMVWMPMFMFINLIHYTIKELSINKGFEAGLRYMATEFCKWADNYRLLELTFGMIHGPEEEKAFDPDQFLKDIQDDYDDIFNRKE